MSLSKLAAKVEPNADPVFAQMVVHGEPLEFRRPEPADFPSEEKALSEIARLVPEYEGQQHATILLLGKCYRSTAEEGEVNPYALFAELEDKNKLFFTDLVSTFFSAFPALSAWLREKEAAKNASPDGTEAAAASS